MENMTVAELQDWLASIPGLHMEISCQPQVRMDPECPYIPLYVHGGLQYSPGPTRVRLRLNRRFTEFDYHKNMPDESVVKAWSDALIRLGVTPPNTEKIPN